MPECGVPFWNVVFSRCFFFFVKVVSRLRRFFFFFNDATENSHTFASEIFQHRNKLFNVLLKSTVRVDCLKTAALKYDRFRFTECVYIYIYI